MSRRFDRRTMLGGMIRGSVALALASPVIAAGVQQAPKTGLAWSRLIRRVSLFRIGGTKLGSPGYPKFSPQAWRSHSSFATLDDGVRYRVTWQQIGEGAERITRNVVYTPVRG
ncbi:MAG: hypothetical protein OXG79_12535 [Chloroflexi bacterium]|nr:hypothetical protein [Chloroflexota bacterium]